LRISWFIARRLIGQRSYKSGASGPIITIGITAIALGIIAMLVALGTGVGLKQEIGEKNNELQNTIEQVNKLKLEIEIKENKISKTESILDEINHELSQIKNNISKSQ